MRHKYHTWRRLPAIQLARKDTFYCNHPSCFKKTKLSTLDKKFMACSNCGTVFILDVNTITPEMDMINCPKCIGVEPNEETKQFESIKEETTSFIESSFALVKVELAKKQNELEKREAQVIKLEEKLEHQREQLRKIVDNHRALFSRRRTNLKDIQENLAQRERELKFKEEKDEVDTSVLADAVLTLFKKMEDQQHDERDGSLAD